MLLSEDSDEQLFKKHQDLCSKLSLDLETLQQSWDTFVDIKANYTIEGDPVHWLCCALFVACKKTTVQTVGRTVVEGNCVSFTSLLRSCNLSLTQFFNKITKWADMARMTEEMRLKIKRLEGNFAVSYHVFKKYIPIFSELFKGPLEPELMKQPRNRKQSISRSPPCTPTKVFEFCWILFTTVKGEISSCSEDIVESYHLLQACCDLAFKNAFLDDRRDLVNPNFPELPSNWTAPNYIIPKEAPCIIDYLCKNHNGISTEAKYVKEYSWKTLIKGLFTKHILQGNEDNFTKLFDPEHFDYNLKNITKAYEAHLLNKGDFDERIFLAEHRRRLLLKKRALALSYGEIMWHSDTTGDAILTDSPLGSGIMSETPPGTKRAIGSQDCEGSLATTSIHSTRLQTLLSGRQPIPSETLIQIFQSCIHDPGNRIKQIVDEIGEKFCRESTRQNANYPSVSSEFANEKLQLATVLFYRFVENIFLREKLQRKDISNLAQQDIFYQCTLACCLEIITYLYNCQRKFPWILNALNLQPFYFVRVIELIVRLQDQLPREAVKHLHMVEQKIIDSLIWKSESPIWKVLRNSGAEFPKFEDIALPANMMHADKYTDSIMSQKLTNGQLLSPGPSAVDRFQSPIINTINSDIKKQLFKPSQFIVEKDGVNQFLPLIEKQEPVYHILDIQQALPANNKPKKTGSLSIILRKFYNLSYARMEHLCNLLNIVDLKFRQKIWTVFEHSVREHTDLMRDRHLDQLLMCAVYVVCKVTGTKERKFAEIMEHYRVQPQASSHIYRNVLIERGNINGNGDVEDSVLAEEKRGDLISFYNTVYVQVMRSFALQFSPNSNQNIDVTLSPLPMLHNSNLVSPRFQISNNLFITPYDPPPTCFTKGKTLEFHFSRSPSKDLEKINTAINKSIVGKRILGDEDETEPPNKRVNRKMQSLVEERRNHIIE